jgi:pimeloyl-ACP methyl ester carboxylesterase
MQDACISRRAVWPVAVLLLFGWLLPAGCSPGRNWEAALLLSDIAAGQKPSALKRWTPSPERRPIAFTVDGKHYRGDLYRPANGIRAGLLLIPGAAEEGRDDPRLVAFAMSLARVHFAVLVPELTGLRQLQVGPENIIEVADAFRWLVADAELVPEGRAGMVAFSYAAGPALIAALRESIRNRVRFIFAVGGYYDLEQTLTFFTTGYYCYQGRWQYLKPLDYGKWAFVASNIHRLRDPRDRRLFRAMARRLFMDPSASVEDLAARLGKEGRSLYNLVTNRNPCRVPQLLADLPAAIRQDISALNPAEKNLTRLEAHLILVHGYEDPMIPFTQSIELAEALPPDQTELFLVHGLVHVDIKPGFFDRWRMWLAVRALLKARDGKY